MQQNIILIANARILGQISQPPEVNGDKASRRQGGLRAEPPLASGGLYDVQQK